MFTHPVRRQLPPGLEELADLALDLRWTGSQTVGRIWRRLDPEGWERTGNPHMILQNVHQERLEEAGKDEQLKKELQAWLERRESYQMEAGWFGEQYAQHGLTGIAYFSMEFGLSEGLPIYSGGLGILAGDHLKSASDLGVPVVGIGLLYQQGYFRQVLDADGSQLEAFPYNDPGTLPIEPATNAEGRWPRVRLELPGRELLLRIWKAQVGKVTLYLLDSNDPMNNPWDRGITANLYAAGRDNRLLQELVLGIGGWRLLEKLDIQAQVCHLNEGHAAFAVLARAQGFAEANGLSFDTALWATRVGNVFTTHTPVAAAFDKFEPALLAKYAQPFLQQTGLTMQQLLAMGRQNPADESEPFNMAYMAMRGCGRVNAVSRLHGEVSRKLFAGLFPRRPVSEVPVSYVTNGVHVPSWDSDAANRLWTVVNNGRSWLNDLHGAARGIARVDDETLWSFRVEARKGLIEYVRRRLERQLRERGRSADIVARARHVLDANALTLGFARRFTDYKRPNLLLHQPERLAALLKNIDRPVQLLVSGKAHPNDGQGKDMVRAIAGFAARMDLRDRVVFLEDYDMAVAQALAGGVDVWINTPRRPAEACGTSGMKVLINGGLNLSVKDGWWDEAFDPAVGWAIGDSEEPGSNGDWITAEQLYGVLESQVIPEFYDRDETGVPRAWVARVRASMERLTPQFSSRRMVREYVEHVYMPAFDAFLERSNDHARRAASLQQWSQSVREGWRELRFGRMTRECVDGQLHVEVHAYLGELEPNHVQVELYAESCNGEPPTRIPLGRIAAIPGSHNGHRFEGRFRADRPPEHFTPRALPRHPDAFVPVEATDIYWGTF